MFDIDAATSRSIDESSGSDIQSECLRLGVVGYGSFAEEFAISALNSTSNCEVTTLVSGSNPDGVDVETILSYEQFAQGTGTDNFDAVYIVTPNDTHLEKARRAIRGGCHVICEKPLGTDVEEAAALAREATSEGLVLQTANRVRYDPMIRELKTAIASGVIGDVVNIHSDIGFHLPCDAGWRTDLSMAGGGAMYDVGVYPINTIRFLLGKEPKSVTASVVPLKDDLRMDEHANFQLTFSNSTVAMCTASYGVHPSNSLRIIGTEGFVEVENIYTPSIPASLRIKTDDATVELEPDEYVELVEQFDSFARACLSGDYTSAERFDGVRDLAVVDAVYESARTGEEISVPAIES